MTGPVPLPPPPTHGPAGAFSLSQSGASESCCLSAAARMQPKHTPTHMTHTHTRTDRRTLWEAVFTAQINIYRDTLNDYSDTRSRFGQEGAGLDTNRFWSEEAASDCGHLVLET